MAFLYFASHDPSLSARHHSSHDWKDRTHRYAVLDCCSTHFASLISHMDANLNPVGNQVNLSQF